MFIICDSISTVKLKNANEIKKKRPIFCSVFLAQLQWKRKSSRLPEMYYIFVELLLFITETINLIAEIN